MAILTCVVTCDRLPYSIRTVESLLAAWRPGDAIVIVDNASTDGTVDWLAGLWEERRRGIVRVMLNPENRYPGAATNQGWDAVLAEGARYGISFDLLHRSDNDIEYLPGWQADVEAAFTDPTLALLGILNLHEDRGLNLDDATGVERTGTVGGNVVMPRRLFEIGLRWSDRPWEPGFGEDGNMSHRAWRHGWVGRLNRTVANNIAFNRYDDFPDYYDRTALVRGLPDARRSV